MAHCCLGKRDTIKEFTFLLIHVLHVSHPAALEGSSPYTREIVDRFFSEHTQIDVSFIERYDCTFRNVVADSRLEIHLLVNQRDLTFPTIRSINTSIRKDSQ